ncbi:HMG box, partial [Ancylostoma duodenale]
RCFPKAQEGLGAGEEDRTQEEGAESLEACIISLHAVAEHAKLAKPGKSVVEVAKAAGAEWAKVVDKSKWEKLAAEEKKRYEKEMVAYKGVALEAPGRKVVKAKPKLIAFNTFLYFSPSFPSTSPPFRLRTLTPFWLSC